MIFLSGIFFIFFQLEIFLKRKKEEVFIKVVTSEIQKHFIKKSDEIFKLLIIIKKDSVTSYTNLSWAYIVYRLVVGTNSTIFENDHTSTVAFSKPLIILCLSLAVMEFNADFLTK